VRVAYGRPVILWISRIPSLLSQGHLLKSDQPPAALAAGEISLVFVRSHAVSPSSVPHGDAIASQETQIVEMETHNFGKKKH
jgi:hypothetical protein